VPRIAFAAAAATVLLRLPFAASRLWDHDSVQLALGVERFDLAAHHPHPPGYPLYIALLKLLAACGVEPLDGMVALSILAGAAGAAALVLLVGRLAGEGPGGAAAGLFAGALYATNPLLWFYGELPLVYAVEGGMTAVVAWAVAGMAGSRRRFLLACGLLALAGGLRPSTLVLLAPLLLYGLARTWRHGRLTLGLLAAGAAVGAAGVALWLLPLLAAAGGLTAYRQLSAAHFGALLPRTSVLYGAGGAALAHNLELLVKWAAQGLLPAALTVAALALIAPHRLGAGLRLLASRGAFLAAWAGPPILFFALFHLTKAGYTLIHLPALLAAAALTAAPLLAERPLPPNGETQDSGRVGGRLGAVDGRRGGPPAGELASRWETAQKPGSAASSRGGGPPGRARGSSKWVRPAAAAALAAVLGATLFLQGRDRPPGAPRWEALFRHEFNRSAISAYEADLDQALGGLGRFPPETTVLVTVELAGGGAAGSEGFLYPWQRHLQWYLPAYPLVYLALDGSGGGLAFTTRGHAPFVPSGPDIELPAGTERLVFVLSGPTGERLPLPPAEVVLQNRHFLILAVPLQGRTQGVIHLGPFLLTPGAGGLGSEAGARVGPW
jgi:hypothetical protein